MPDKWKEMLRILLTTPEWSPSRVVTGAQNVLGPVVVAWMPSDTDAGAKIIYRAMFSHRLSTSGLQGSQ